jgi:hypothetical protein
MNLPRLRLYTNGCLYAWKGEALGWWYCGTIRAPNLRRINL